MSKVIYPNVQTVWKDVSTEEVLIDKYLSAVDDNRKYSLLAIPYCFDAEKFLRKYKERCIIYYNTPRLEDGLMLFIHQLSPTLHLHSRLFCTVEKNRVHDYISTLVFYRNHEDATKFIHEAFSLSKKGDTDDNPHGGFKV